jgi:serine/threonine-protein kinase SRPK3
MSTDELYKEFDKLVPKPAARFNNRPLPNSKHVIVPEKNRELVSLIEAEIFLSCFGESFVPAVTQGYVPNIFVPPEVYFLPQEPTSSFSSDIWSLACAIWAIISLRTLFQAPTDKIIVEHVEPFGKLPPEWWQKWDNWLEWFNEKGVGINGDNTSLEELFESDVQMPRREAGMEEVGEEEKAALLDMLKAMMAFKPGERVTAEQITKCKWMTEWGLPELSALKRPQEY